MFVPPKSLDFSSFKVSVEISKQRGELSSYGSVRRQLFKVRDTSILEQIGNIIKHSVELSEVVRQFFNEQTYRSIAGIELNSFAHILLHRMRLAIISDDAKRLIGSEKSVGSGKCLNDVLILQYFVHIQRVDPLSLKSLADREGWQTFVIPDDVGGRYSVLTAVGLLPMAVAGIDIDAVLRGAQKAMTELDNDDFSHNPCYRYAALRNILLRRGKAIEIYASYEPRFTQMGEWLKQLYGESEGKDGKGLFPASVAFTTDLHSMGQFIQDGSRNLFETVIDFITPAADLTVEDDAENLDGLNFLSGMAMRQINRRAMQGTILAHTRRRRAQPSAGGPGHQ